MPACTRIVALIASLMLAACSGGAKAEKDSSDTTIGTPQKAAEASTALAACTGGSVPQFATSCLLDLGTGTDSYWDDTDGVAPGTAGCHVEYDDAACSLVKTGREFGEFCLDDDRLVESNPGAGECHTHGGDKGKPDVVSCAQWCQTTAGSGGRCEGGVAVQATNAACESARCVCG